ncbi:MAG TPA: hypothetical protein VHX13_12415 [Acidobacteriaceae bacterium]|jgi:hypothetical protein|nr:hypothetical protein [Acidobacteriaceae bacterium]
MMPSELTPERFRSYPPEARELVVAHLALLRQIPTIYAASLLREVIGYDWMFPAERAIISAQLACLSALPSARLTALFADFAQIRLDRKLEEMNWVQEPTTFSERLTAWLWSTHQVDAFRVAAIDFNAKLTRALPVAPPPPMARLGMVVIGQGVERNDFPLFRKLLPHGVHFTRIDPTHGVQDLLDAVGTRARSHPLPYAHWYIDGNLPLAANSQIVTVSYEALQPVRSRLLDKMRAEVRSGTGGPEELERDMATMTPGDLGMKDSSSRSVLDRFAVNVLTQGSGTQIFSTTFVQWTAREALRRAEPLTLLARYSPRQRQRPMNELLEGPESGVELDPQGSLRDADMGAWYIWLDQGRLSHADESSFLVWFEGQNQALAVSPDLPRGTESHSPATLRQVLQWIS